MSYIFLSELILIPRKINLSTHLTIVSCRMMGKCWLLKVCSDCHVPIQLQSLSFTMSFQFLRFSSVPFLSFPPVLDLGVHATGEHVDE